MSPVDAPSRHGAIDAVGSLRAIDIVELPDLANAFPVVLDTVATKRHDLTSSGALLPEPPGP